MPMNTLQYIQTYTIFHCDHDGCGIAFGLDDSFVKSRRNDRKTWYCPNGHSRWFPGKTEAQEERDRANQLEKIVRAREEDIRIEQRRLMAERRAHSATKGKLTKTKNRAAHAMCPVEGCRRSFANVAKHIAGQHPGFKAKS